MEWERHWGILPISVGDELYCMVSEGANARCGKGTHNLPSSFGGKLTVTAWYRGLGRRRRQDFLHLRASKESLEQVSRQYFSGTWDSNGLAWYGHGIVSYSAAAALMVRRGT